MPRLILAFLLLIISLLVLFKAPAYHTWLLSVAVTEYPMIFIASSGLVLIWGCWSGSYRLTGTLVSLSACVLYLYPILTAFAISRKVDKEFETAFAGSVRTKGDVFSFKKLFTANYKEYVAYKTLGYTPGESPLSLDFYPSALPGIRPCVLVIHGGSWSSGDSRQLPELNSYLSRQGYHVAAINYRKAPAYHNPAPREDVRAALSFLKSNADSLHLDVNQFVLLGRSAGGQIALLSAYTLNDPAIKGVISFYGPADMVWGYSRPSNPLVMNSRKVMENYLGRTYAQAPESYFDSSPLEFVTHNSPATLMLHGENDVLVAYEHNLHLIEKLKEYQVPYFLLSIPYAVHGFDFNLNGPSGQLSTYTVLRFLKAVTR